MRGHELVVDARQQLVRVEAADHRENPRDTGIGEGGVEVGKPVRDRRGGEVVTDVDVLTEAQREPEAGQPAVGFRAHLRGDDAQRSRRCDNPHASARFQLGRDDDHGPVLADRRPAGARPGRAATY